MTRSPTLPRLRLPLWLAAVLGLAGGLAVGALTSILQSVLPDTLQQTANAGAVWVVAAFVAGALIAKPAPHVVVAGLGTQAGAVIGYYVYAEFARDGMGDLLAPFVWFALALLAGPIFGMAGAAWRERRLVPRVTAAAVLGGVFGMESLWYFWKLDYVPEALAFLALALLIPIALGRSVTDRALAVAAVVPISLIAYTFYDAMGQLTGLG